MFPLRFGTDEDFAAVRSLFARSGYTEEAVCRHFGLKVLGDYRLDGPPPVYPGPSSSGFEAIVRLFLQGCFVTAEEIALAGPDAQAVLEKLGLVEHAGEGRYFAPMALVHVNGFYVASDRWNRPDGSAFAPQDDVVYPAHIPNTQLFVTSIDDSPCESFLDIGSGSGIAALVATRFAKRVVATDIAERAVLCAQFNARLNEITNMEVLASDLYDALEGQTFDRIAAHPPYVPAAQKKWIFHSGGEDGEQIMRGIVRRLPEFLRLYGRCYLLSMGSDRKGAKFDERLRQMLESNRDEFDIGIMERNVWPADEFAAKQGLQHESGSTKSSLLETFKKLEVVSLVYGTFVLQRRPGGRPFTIRRPAGKEFRKAQIEWAMRWETFAHEPESVEKILSSPLYPAQNVRLHVLHKLDKQDWHPLEYYFEIDYPFSSKSPCHSWMVRLLAALDGRVTGQGHFETLREGKFIPAAAAPAEFAEALKLLISAGLIELEGMRIPRLAASSAAAGE